MNNNYKHLTNQDNIMKRYHIFLIDPITGEAEKTEAFTGTLPDLKARLRELQSGYCEDEKPRLREVKTSKGVILEAVSDSDYFYACIINHQSKGL